ncbi:hypothetical protein F3Y22_tig00110809pilonHSYRG00236 [Hibiscus syriacus]|uniref:Uncharacterized protein n=1 Tax=Hibiscus syriacus TaxID=106335 RepID=A0A6A2ZRP8_HIBSY|nr:hypothetical protein F3Y22_tig00110809pilonHSYRG00236 [Hibiscus syriacus]
MLKNIKNNDGGDSNIARSILEKTKAFALNKASTLLGPSLPPLQPYQLQLPSLPEPFCFLLPFWRWFDWIRKWVFMPSYTTVVTTRRVLERLAVICVSQRMAWKLLKDVPNQLSGNPKGDCLPQCTSSKLAEQLSDVKIITNVSIIFKVILDLVVTSFLLSPTKKIVYIGHLLGVVDAGLVQTGMKSTDSLLTQRTPKRVIGSTRKSKQNFLERGFWDYHQGGASLIFASIGAGIGATLLRLFGCAAGDLAGPIVVSVCLEKAFHVDL